MSVMRARARLANWPWAVAGIIVAGLVVAAWFLGELVGADAVTSSTHTVVITQTA